VLENLLLFSAQAALADRDYRQAEDDADTLLKKFPGSALRVYAYGVKASSAWEQRRYRLAATNAQQARAELATNSDFAEARAKLGVLEAESCSARETRTISQRRGRLCRRAARAPAGVAVGDLMFQRVLAEIKSGSPNAAQVLDEVEADPAFARRIAGRRNGIRARVADARRGRREAGVCAREQIARRAGGRGDQARPARADGVAAGPALAGKRNPSARSRSRTGSRSCRVRSTRVEG